MLSEFQKPPFVLNLSKASPYYLQITSKVSQTLYYIILTIMGPPGHSPSRFGGPARAPRPKSPSLPTLPPPPPPN